MSHFVSPFGLLLISASTSTTVTAATASSATKLLSEPFNQLFNLSGNELVFRASIRWSPAQ